MNRKVKSLIVAGLFGLGAMSGLLGGTAQASTPYANATVEGALAPGVYGRIEIGNAPPPPLIYVQPVIIQRAPVLVQQPPLYLHVPPGHAKKWSKHCAKYNACDRQVYFVRVNGDDDFERRRGNERDDHRGYEDDRGRDYDKGHGNGNGNGNGKDKDKGKGHNKKDRD